MKRGKPARRAAIVGGVAAAAKKHAGKKSEQSQAAGQAPPTAPPTAQPNAPTAAATPTPQAGDDAMFSQLENLKKLLDEGVLSQEEFDMEKQKILASS